MCSGFLEDQRFDTTPDVARLFGQFDRGAGHRGYRLQAQNDQSSTADSASGVPATIAPREA